MKQKKLSTRILSLVLTVAMVGTLLPATVFAAEGTAPLVAITRTTTLDLETNADITYVGTDGTNKTANPTTTSITDTGEGWSWDLGTKALTLSGANITNTGNAEPITSTDTDLVSYCSYGIILPTGSTIELTENTVNYATGGNIDTSSDLTTQKIRLDSAGVCVENGTTAALTIQGKGTLNATGGTLMTGDAVGTLTRAAYSYGITSSDSLNIKGGTVSATGGDVTANSDCPQVASYGISSAYNITVDDAANVTATGGYAEGTFKAHGSNNAGFADSYGIDVGENIAITSSTVNAIGGATKHTNVDETSEVEGYPTSTGISNGLSTTINGGTVTAHAVHTGINTMENITINNGSTVVADGTYFGITAQMALSIEDSTVTASGLDESAEMGFGILSPAISINSGNVIAQGTILAMACLGEDGPGADITIAEGATIVGSEENAGTTSAAEIGTAEAMGMEVPCMVLTDTKAGAKDVDISFGSSGNTSVSFDARNGGAITKADIDKVSGTITMPAAPTWGDYTFVGWYMDKDGKGTAFANSGLTNSVTVYAKWTKNGKTVRTEPLDLTGRTDLSGDGYTWDNTSKTLTLSGMTLNSSKLDTSNNARGILFPNEACTIILADGTENTVDVSAAKNSLQSQAIFSENKLTIKTSGKGTPGKLNAIAANATDSSGTDATDPSIGIYAGGGIVIESGNITATAGDSTNDNSIGISTNASDIHIKGGTVNATGGKSRGTGTEGSFGLYGANVQIDDGTVT
ncbi:MAG: InlB B-repeat-containing protein, partial [Clostridia bacterium]